MVSVLFLAGCKTVNWQQYEVSGVSVGSQYADQLQTVLQTVADQSGLTNRTAESKVPGILVLYSQPSDKKSRVELGARFENDEVFVDLYGGVGPEPMAYTQAKGLLFPMLKSEFHSRVSIPRPFVQIP